LSQGNVNGHVVEVAKVLM